MMTHGNNRGSDGFVLRARRGSARMAGVLLGIVALIGAGAAGYAIWTLAQPAPVEEIVEQPMDRGVAPTQTIEGVLASVQSFVRDEEYGRARSVLESAIAQYPVDQDLRISMGELMMLMEDYAGAYDQYVSAIEIGPSAPGMEFTAGTLANSLGNRDLAIGHYKSAQRMDPSNPDPPMYLAGVQIQLNELDAAKTNLALVNQIAPDRAQAWAMRAEIALRENKLGIAQQMVDKARALQPRVVQWIVLDAQVHKRAGDINQSVNLLSGLPQEEIDEPGILSLLAECFGMLGRPGDAASRYIDAAQMNPQNSVFAFNAAVWLERASDRENALKWGRRARDLGHPRAADWIETLP